jgi:type IV fimbrial biogenesis protein FimT
LLVKKPAKSAGFTLIELMIVLVIAGLALGFGIPGFQQLMGRQQLNIAATDLFHAIQLTRSEAIQRGRVVQLRPLDDADWTQGWRIYAGKNRNASYRDGDPLILQRGALPAGIQLDKRAGDPPEIYIAYNGEGHSIRRNGSRLSDSWRLRLKQETRIILINFQGRARLCDPARDSRNCAIPDRPDSPDTTNS